MKTNLTDQNPPDGPRVEDAKAFFKAYTAHVPTPLAVRESMRMVALLPLLGGRKAVLDVGCGDGAFWELCPCAAEHHIDGIDLSSKETSIAQGKGVFRDLAIGDITQSPPKEAAYDLVLGNCSLEHIPDIQAALANMLRSLKSGGKIVLFVPAPGWTRTLGPIRALTRWSQRIGMSFGLALDGFFQHHHLYNHHIWQLLLERAGFEDIQVSGLGGRVLNRQFSRNLPLAFLEFLWKAASGRYPGWPILRSRTLSADGAAELSGLGLDPASEHTVEYCLVATRPEGTR